MYVYTDVVTCTRRCWRRQQIRAAQDGEALPGADQGMGTEALAPPARRRNAASAVQGGAGGQADEERDADAGTAATAAATAAATHGTHGSAAATAATKEEAEGPAGQDAGSGIAASAVPPGAKKGGGGGGELCRAARRVRRVL